MAGLKLLEAKGVSRSLLPQVACDCSGYVCWALGVHREGHPGIGSLNTDAMVADAAGARRLLVPLAIDKAVPGALLVHPWPGGASKAPGHVAIVTEVGANGRPTRMLHCAPGNILVDPPAGLPRSAIAETGTQMFDENRTTVLLMWNAFLPRGPGRHEHRHRRLRLEGLQSQATCTGKCMNDVASIDAASWTGRAPRATNRTRR